ncbi:MAG: thioredoxin-like domain-containing protein [Gemmataceae bacterium]
MDISEGSSPKSTPWPLVRWLGLGCVLVAMAGLAVAGPQWQRNAASSLAATASRQRTMKAPELEGGVAWLNTAGPLRMKDLRGKIVLLDFWTFCCINCIHVLPDLAKLEKKYPNELVVIGVHSAKFENEKNTAAIRKAILRYEIAHPVVNDANMSIWRAFGARAWPSLILIDPEGEIVWRESGEGLYEDLDREIANLIKIHKAKKTLNTKPMKFELALNSGDGNSPLFFPGKVVPDIKGNRLFIADSTHHRIVITDLAGKKIAIAGTGEPGVKNGAFDAAQFNDPQGMALRGEILYVADRKNHLIRALDLKNQTVSTVAGTGEQGRDRDGDGPALKVGLNSPWDVLIIGSQMYIAMAGHHQIWVMDLDKNRISAFAGDGGEDIVDGRLDRSRFAQPSGLTTNGRTLWVADSETSSIRAVPLTSRGEVRTVVGLDLFKFGDEDGVGDNVRLQHALGVAYHDGKLYVADTYNNKIKQLDPVTRECKTFLGGKAEGSEKAPMFSEPGGITYADGKLYVADTNAHRIRIIDLKTREVSTLKLQGVEAPKVR